MIIELSENLGRQLLLNKQILALAESCTGGGIAQAVTAIAGSSAWLDRGFVTYSNAAKHEMLGVPMALIEQHGAVSESVAKAMAAGVLKNSLATISLSVTGVAGPGGGSAEKPVGTVWFAVATDSKLEAFHRQFDGDRAAVREQACAFALTQLYASLGSA